MEAVEREINYVRTALLNFWRDSRKIWRLDVRGGGSGTY